MVTQLRAMLLSTSSAELCVDEGLSVDSPEEVDWWPCVTDCPAYLTFSFLFRFSFRFHP